MTEATQMPSASNLEYFRSPDFKDPSDFWGRLRQAYLSSDGVWQASDWRGFVFPAEPTSDESPGEVPHSGSSSAYVSFVGQTFAHGADLSDVTFRSHARLSAATFAGSVTFANASFEQDVSLDSSTFAGNASFQEAHFQGRITLNGVTFQGDASFETALFEDGASFENGSFAGSAYFQRVSFRGAVSLNGVTFQGDASFENGSFADSADFQQAQFLGAVDLHGCEFNIQPIFEGTKFVRDPDLTDATVGGKPLVVGAGRVGSRRGAGNDRVAQEDQLNFSDYVDAFVELIRSSDTNPPLTIGIFGSWGMGKSFLLDHIERRIRELQGEPTVDKNPRRQRQQWRKLRRRQKRQDRQAERAARVGQKNGGTTLAQPSTRRVHVVRFNAWEYSATDVIWPGLVRKIMDRLEVEIAWGFPGRFLYRLWRNVLRQIRENQGRLVAAIAIAVGLVAFALWRFSGDKALIGRAAVLALLLAVAKLVVDGLSNPLSKWVTTLFEERDYGKQIGYMADIRQDLEFLEHRLQAAGGRILITIDDLDRCEPEKTVEVLQAISLLLNFDSFIVCLGIDARVVTRAVEDHYKGLLGAAGASGYEYLDKVVQIPFRIPEPTGEEVRTFLSRQMGDPQPKETWAPPSPAGTRASPTPTGKDGGNGHQQGSKASTSAGVDRPKEATPAGPVEEPVDFTWSELKAFQDLSAFLRPNPRHLKRLVNVYRLVRTLALVKGQTAIHDHPATTTRWLAMCGQWPYTSYAMLRHLDDLLEDKQRYDRAKASEVATDNPLAYLYKQVAPRLSEERQQLLDDDIAVLKRLLNGWAGHITWEQLEALRQYTINFNPAIEAELESPPEDSGTQPEVQGGAAASNAAGKPTKAQPLADD
jgi:hypothetical protein